MNPATPWTEFTGSQTSYIKGLAASETADATILFGIVMPIVGGVAFPDVATSYTEMSVAATASTEMTVPSTSWAELTL